MLLTWAEEKRQAVSVCSVAGCDGPGVFRTRTRPTWCSKHLKDVYDLGGLVLLEEFTNRQDHLLTRCTHCGFEGHYRFEYVLDRNKAGERVCRACFWRDWAGTARPYAGGERQDVEETKALAKKNGYTYLSPLTSPVLAADPHRVQCVKCGRITAERPGDMGWGCPCRKSPKTSTAGAAKTPGSNLLMNSDNHAVTWWDHDKNPESLWRTAKVRGRKEARWICDKEHSFKARILDVTDPSRGCPVCREKWLSEYQAKREAEEEQYRGLTVADVPELLAAWDDPTPPELVPVLEFRMTGGGYRFRCPKGHANTRQVRSWLNGSCASCKAQKTRRERQSVVKDDPSFTRLTPEISSQWDHEKNGKLKLSTISPESRRVVWWKDSVCGHKFRATPRERDKYQRLRCPECQTILDSLAYHYPEIAQEWSEENPISPWHIRPTTTMLAEVPLWNCPNDPGHTWRAMPGNRVNGSTCPMCQSQGKSQIELSYAEAAEQIWGNALSGQRIHSPVFRGRGSWSVVLVILGSDLKLVIEYDGSYWHKDKVDLDMRKSLELLEAGYLVCRLRESPLGPLDITDPGYQELVIYSGAQDPLRELAEVEEWISFQTEICTSPKDL